MRTAYTIIRTEAGWHLRFGPDVPADKQREAINEAVETRPIEVLETRFQFGDRNAKTRSKEKAAVILRRLIDVEERAEKKQRLRDALKKLIGRAFPEKTKIAVTPTSDTPPPTNP